MDSAVASRRRIAQLCEPSLLARQRRTRYLPAPANPKRANAILAVVAGRPPCARGQGSISGGTHAACLCPDRSRRSEASVPPCATRRAVTARAASNWAAVAARARRLPSLPPGRMAPFRLNERRRRPRRDVAGGAVWCGAPVRSACGHGRPRSAGDAWPIDGWRSRSARAGAAAARVVLRSCGPCGRARPALSACGSV